MAKESSREQSAREQNADNNWWVEKLKTREKVKLEEGQAFVGANFFRSVEGYDQEEATKNLTDLNLKLLTAANPAPGEWGYVALVEQKSPPTEIDKVKRALPLPPDARAVLVDSGLSLRVIVTGTPVGERCWSSISLRKLLSIVGFAGSGFVKKCFAENASCSAAPAIS